AEERGEPHPRLPQDGRVAAPTATSAREYDTRTAMTRPVRFGVTLPQIKRTWAEAREAAMEFDRLGFHSIWVCDHLYGVPMPSLPILEGWSELAAVPAIPEPVALA